MGRVQKELESFESNYYLNILYTYIKLPKTNFHFFKRELRV